MKRLNTNIHTYRIVYSISIVERIRYNHASDTNNEFSISKYMQLINNQKISNIKVNG